MSLISCRECGMKVSSLAPNCIHCGYPLNLIVETAEVENHKKPTLADDLYVPHWFMRYALALYFDESLNPDLGLASNKAKIEIFKHGIYLKVNGDSRGNIPIHYSQIVACEIIDERKSVEMNRSVLGRALVGGVLLGGVGAIVGGISGVGKSAKTYDLLLKMTYYEPENDAFETYHLLGMKKECYEIFVELKDMLGNG